MNHGSPCRGLMLATAGLLSVGLLGCAAEQAPTPPEAAKVPITTASAEARELYVEGRDLLEKLRVTDARSLFQQAVEQDPDFALAHLGLANTSTTTEEFFASLKAAVAAAGDASAGERHLILAAEAAADGDPATQQEHLSALVESFPEDERARNALGTYYFGRQEYGRAVQHYEKATAINPDFSQPYNQLGYAQRFLGDYDGAELAFQKYVELIPDEPNPYDSYAELLMKLGRYQESIENYEKALEKDPNFVASYVGIGNNQVFMGQAEQARETFAKLAEIARNDGERRQALFWTANSFVHEGNTERALETLRERYAIAERTQDYGTLAGDLVLMGNVQLEGGDPRAALASYNRALEMMEQSTASDEAKQNFRRNGLYREARVALAEGDPATAKQKTQAYGERAAARAIPFELRRHHELQGLIAMQEKDYAGAVEHLSQANQQNPRILYLTALAHEGQGDAEAARDACERAANFNGLNFNYAFVRDAARSMLERG